MNKNTAIYTILLFLIINSGFMVFFDKRNYKNNVILERILETNDITKFDLITGDAIWDVICYIDQYSLASERLSSYLSEDLRKFKFVPDNKYFQEEENGIAIINFTSRTIYIYSFDVVLGGLFSKIKYTRPAINSIKGPRCLNKENASFIVQDISGPNSSYTQLNFVGSSQ